METVNIRKTTNHEECPKSDAWKQLMKELENGKKSGELVDEAEVYCILEGRTDYITQLF
jgi:RNA polymerase-interacting CarD/CdnL/TRCF family regulator